MAYTGKGQRALKVFWFHLGHLNIIKLFYTAIIINLTKYSSIPHKLHAKEKFVYII